MRDATPSIPQVVVFDTAFHLAGLPPKAYRYALPERCYTDYRIRRYGAHGTSHKYAAETAAQMLGKDVTELNVIICHLGSGGSVSAVRGGQCVDTTMGFTPLEGIMMGTRAGSIDPAIVTYIMRRENATPDEVDALLNTESGMLGVSGYSNDYRELEDAAARGSESAQMALEMYIYTIQKAIGQFFAVLPGTDAIVMTAGIGENSATARSNICQGLEQLGIKLDPERNRGETYDRIISSDDSPVKVLVVCADEEMCIARETAEIVEAL
jgi:acetate kinase